MRRHLRRHAIGYLALFVALGGTSYAAAKLPRNSVTSATVKDRSLQARDFKRGQLPAGKAGPLGQAGPAGAAGSAGPAGPAGPQGPAGTITGDLPRGTTVRGLIGLSPDANETGYAPIAFGGLMSSAPKVELLGGPSEHSEGCRWSEAIQGPEAEPGHLCVYLARQWELQAPSDIGVVGADGRPGATRYGGMLVAAPSSNGSTITGVWAATAP